MTLVLVALGLQAGGGLGAALLGRSRRRAAAAGVGGVVAGAAVGLVPALRVLLGGRPEAWRVAWDVPLGAFAVGLDPLSALFLVPVLVLSAVAAIYGAAYLRAHDGPPGASWFFFDTLVASMTVVLVARNAVLFLVAWEAMALASFFLVTADDADPAVREAGRTYLVATRLGTACLLVLFIVLGAGADPLDFDRFAPGAHAGLVFALALVGFGTKAGLVPFHVWLPEAHPAAPSHVSAVMSGAMIEMGLYGLLRIVTLAGPLPAWCGGMLVAVGAASALLGIVWALAQRDMKRLLAYSSVEHVGLIALALGVGLVGLDAGAARVAVLGVAAGLLHVLGHAAMKGALFLGIGAVARQTGTRRLDAQGGLLRRLPATGVACLAAGLAIAGLPPLAGFASELVLYLAAYTGTVTLDGAGALSAAAAVGTLALVGGLAAACFAMLFGVAFLGEPRTPAARDAREPAPALWVATAVLAALAVGLGVLAPAVLRRLAPVVAEVTGLAAGAVAAELADAAATLRAVVVAAGGLFAVTAALAALRHALLRRRPVAAGPTWDCGYAAPSARMQYTAASFAAPLTATFRPVVPLAGDARPPRGFFPDAAPVVREPLDLVRERVYAPAFQAVARGLARFRWLQHGQVHVYVLYIAVTLVGLLLWRVGAR
jgi:hydrogenase-4 component B